MTDLVYVPAAEMDDVRGGHVDEVIAARAQPAAEVDVLAVHEEAVVEAAKLLEQRPAEKDAGSRNPVRRSRSLVCVGAPDELVGPRGAGKEPVQEEGARVGRAQSRKSPLRVVELAVRVPDARCGGARALVG